MPHAHSDDALTLARLLQEPALRRARIHAGRAGAVTRLDWVVPWGAAQTDEPLSGVLVHAHAADLAEEGTTLERAAARLADRGAAALLVDGHPAGPACAGAAARMPLATMAETVPFAVVSRLVAELALARETHDLRYGLQVHRALAELLYRGAELSALCSQMSRMSRRPVAVFDSSGALAALEQPTPRMVEPDDLVAAFAGQAETLGASGEPRELHPRLADIVLDGREVACTLTPIVLGGRHDGWVLLLEESDDPHPHDLAQHRVLIEQAAPIIGTEMLRLRSVQRAKEQARGDFVHGLLHGRFATLEDISARAAHYQFPVRSWFGVVVASGLTTAADVDSPARLQGIAMQAARLLPEQDRHTQAAMVGDVLVVVREAARRGTMGTPDNAVAAIGEYATALHRYLCQRKDQGSRPIRVAYGRPVVGALAIPDSYREARLAHGLQGRLELAAVCGYQELRVHAVLEEVAASRTGRSFAVDVLAPLRDPAAGELEATVLAYVAAGGNVNAAARDLHIHRNTMLYKLDRASRLLGMDLRQAENQFAVWLAHTLDLLAATGAEVDRVVRPA
ncbi:PucR family transcriptional regulator [Trujillonella humicola]|uniref:PucR family transcriptional regulator n=1 Tax=Trujillonella humicola TaxID=3383699 RepID=UPI0039061BB8